MQIGGSILESYLVCKRQAWLGYHAIEGDCDNDYLKQGNYIHQESYKKYQKGKNNIGYPLDTIQYKEGKLIVGEVKKSSHCINSAKLQLAYYLYQLNNEGLEAEGMLQFPEEKKTVTVILTENLKQEVMQTLNEVEKLVSQKLPPKAEWKRVCEHCSYCESCWA